MEVWGIIILVKGMKMPKGCDECPLYGIDMRCNITYTPNYTDSRFVELLGNCPLIEISPHGRLIDADALMGRIEHDTPLSSTFEKVVRRYYEHTYFDLARIYKTFDWENKSMLFMGW